MIMHVTSERKALPQNAAALPNPRQRSSFTWTTALDEPVYELAASTNWNLDQAAFDQLLAWLAPDPEQAGHIYEHIRQKLIIVFTTRRCLFAEDLADETINRVTRRLSQIKNHYVGNPSHYFFGVAKKVYLEYLRRLALQKQATLPLKDTEMVEELMFERLEQCISQLSRKDRELILTYYQGGGRSKINHRKWLAEELGISISALRLRVHRIVCNLREKLSVAMSAQTYERHSHSLICYPGKQRLASTWRDSTP
jgi:RNA polymerase sigma factor (sigma-70 family)